jgi:hypothetical protein
LILEPPATILSGGVKYHPTLRQALNHEGNSSHSRGGPTFHPSKFPRGEAIVVLITVDPSAYFKMQGQTGEDVFKYIRGFRDVIETAAQRTHASKFDPVQDTYRIAWLLRAKQRDEVSAEVFRFCAEAASGLKAFNESAIARGLPPVQVWSGMDFGHVTLAESSVLGEALQRASEMLVCAKDQNAFLALNPELFVCRGKPTPGRIITTPQGLGCSILTMEEAAKL